MRIAVLNDFQYTGHIAGEITYRNTLQECHDRGINIIHYVPIANCDESLLNLVAKSRLDVLLVNGASLMSGDNPIAFHMCKAAEAAKAKGIPSVLYNTIWRDNDVLNDYLDVFDKIYCRESESTKQASAHSGKVSTVPDMIFGNARWIEEHGFNREHSICVTDSEIAKMSDQLARFALKQGFTFLTIDDESRNRIEKKRFFRGVVHSLPGVGRVQLFVDSIAQSENMITGRFHGVCVGFMLGVPMAAFDVEEVHMRSLFEDANLDPDLLLAKATGRDLLSRCWKSMWKIREQRPVIAKYCEKAASQIGEMFDEIEGLGKKRRVKKKKNREK